MSKSKNQLVNKAIKSVIFPILYNHGFEAFTSRIAWRFRDDFIDVVEIYSFDRSRADVLKCSTHSFVILLGVYIKVIPPMYRPKLRANPDRPDSSQCHIWGEIEPSIEFPDCRTKGIWYVDPMASNLDAVFSDALHVIQSQALPWFSHFSNLQDTLEILKSDEYQILKNPLNGRLNSPDRNYNIGFVALKIGDYQTAVEALKMAIDSDLYATDQIENDYLKALKYFEGKD